MVEKLVFRDFELMYELHGNGEPVVLLHALAFAGLYAPLVPLMQGLSVLRYERRLLDSGSARPAELTLADEAGIFVRLMDHVGFDRAHVVGHSYGALVALQVALEAPTRVQSVALLEPAIRSVPSADQVAASFGPIFEAYREGDTEKALDLFLRSVCGSGYREVLDRVIPGAFEQALQHADAFFQSEIPIVAQWVFGMEEARRITHPILNAVGSDSERRFIEGSELIQSWFPSAERFVLPDAGHLLMVQDPQGMADGLLRFLRQHPMDGVPPE